MGLSDLVHSVGGGVCLIGCLPWGLSVCGVWTGIQPAPQDGYCCGGFLYPIGMHTCYIPFHFENNDKTVSRKCSYILLQWLAGYE